MIDPKLEWKEFSTGIIAEIECVECGNTATAGAKGWVFRYVGVRGKGKHGAKVRSVRMCPSCWRNKNGKP